MIGTILLEFIQHIPSVAGNVAVALVPICVVFLVFQFSFLHLPARQVLRMFVGILYTFLGLVLFLLGVEVGFQPAGAALGRAMGSTTYTWVLLPIGALLGFVIVFAEPAVSVLNRQVEDVSGGAISRKLMMSVLCVSMAISVTLGMVRVLTGISIWWILVPGYTIALILLKFSPPIFSAIAFDSGGVASGPMTATFLLPLAVGAVESLGGNPLKDAFGMVAMVAMTPLIAIQIVGVLYQRKQRAFDLTPEEIARLDDEDDMDPDDALQIAHEGANAIPLPEEGAHHEDGV